jgi:anti-anti-sigma regulatory factor
MAQAGAGGVMDTNTFPRKKAILLAVHGSLCGFSGVELERAARYWSAAVTDGYVLLDLSRIEFTDSLGIRALLHAAELGNIAFCNPSHELREMFASLPPSSFLPFFESVAEAVDFLDLEISPSPADVPERRTAARVGVHIPTTFRAGDNGNRAVYHGVITNVSATGAFVEFLDRRQGDTEFPLAKGTRVEELELSSLAHGLVMRGVVARVSEDHSQLGVGVHFSEVNASDQNLLWSCIREHPSGVSPAATPQPHTR